MAGAIITYDRDLPEIPGRIPWEPPRSFLVRDDAALGGWRIDDSGRRPSTMLLVNALRQAVDEWRANGYPGASPVTERLFECWFDEEHEVPGYPAPFRFHFCQREAIETLAYVVEIAKLRDARELIDAYAEVFPADLFSQSLEFRTTTAGQRILRRFVPELGRTGEQELPPEGLARYAFKIATGSGKTWVIAMALVWAHFHKQRVPGSPLSTNFLIVAPNVIVYQRLEKDFASNRIFHELPLVPPEWGPWHQKVILRGDPTEPDPSCNLFVTNVQQLYESRDREWTPLNAVEAVLGPKPSKDLASYQRSMLERLRDLDGLLVINDEAHHVHDPKLEWSKSLLSLHAAVPNGLGAWLDFSATPKDQNGMYYPWTVVDYPLAQAVEDRIVKAPLIVTKENDPKRPSQDPDNITKDNVADKYGYWLLAAVERWKEHDQAYRRLGTRPVLFIMAERNVIADAIGQYMWKNREYGLRESEVLVIHTDEAGEITKKDLDKAREAARDIDTPSNRIKAVVSVMMLREGWDVRNVSVVLGLRPFTAKADILPEQVIGRGLRLMLGVTPDRTQTLEVLGTKNLLAFLQRELESEGVGFATDKGDPPLPIQVYAVAERLAYDISIPLTKPSLSRNFKRLSDLDVATLEAIYDQSELEEPLRLRLKMEFATTRSEVHQVDIVGGALPMVQTLVAAITNKMIQRARLTEVFAELYPKVRDYVAQQCFGIPVDIADDSVRAYLRDPLIQDAIAAYLAKAIGQLTVEKGSLEFENVNFKLSDTKPFLWRRDLPPLECKRTIFNYVATYNPFERRFGLFLDGAADVLRFASLGTTEQGDSGTQFRVDYLKSSGGIGFYHPDWVAVQQTPEREVHWIIETKGRVWEGTEAKDRAMTYWCERIRAQTGLEWRFARVNQAEFDRAKPSTLEAATAKALEQPTLTPS